MKRGISVNLNDLIGKYGIDKVNSLTKYPSILIYHDLGERGSLMGTLVDNKSFEDYERTRKHGGLGVLG